MLSLLFGFSASKALRRRVHRRAPYSNGCTAVCTADIGANVRSGPSTSHSILTAVAYNAQVSVTGRDGDWFQVSVDGQTGYILGELLKTPGTVSADGGLNVRSGPSTDYDRINGLNDGSSVTIVEISNGWYKISSPCSGWVSADYVTLSGTSSGGSTGGGGSSASGIPAAPTGTVIRQGDSGLNSNINNWGCAFMSLCWIGGINSVDGCTSMYYTAIDNGWIRSDCYINDWDAAGRGISGSKGFSWVSASETPDSNTREILFCQNYRTSSHYVVGNGNGGIEYDPAYDGSVAYSDCVDKRFFHF